MTPTPPTTKPDPDSWLDFSPSATKTRPSALVSCVDTLRGLLTEIQDSVDNRALLLELAAKNPDYSIITAPNAQWKEWAQAQNRIFYAVKAQIEGYDHGATADKVEDWEKKVEELRRGTLNVADRYDAQNRWANFKEDAGGSFKKGWSWENAKEKGGSGLESEGVCPKEC